MILEGTVIDGKVEPNGPLNWPDGTKVHFSLPADDDEPQEVFEPYDLEIELEILRQSHEDVNNGLGYSLEEVEAIVQARIDSFKNERV